MKRFLTILALLFSGTLAAAPGCERPVVGFLTNGEGCNVDWQAEMPEYDVADAGDRNFLLSQQHWNLDERLLKRRPTCCIVYSGLPEVLLGQPLSGTLEAYRSICERLDTCVIAARPEICFVMAGINDLFNGIPPETLFANQRRIVSRLFAAGIRPVVQPILCVHDDAELNARIRALDAQLRAWCTANRIDWLDPNPLLTDDDGLKRLYTTDGTHLTEQGYEIWSGMLRQYLENTDPTNTR